MNTKRFLTENIYDEGGLAGHMDYFYGYIELTFVEISELIDDLFNARVEHVTEKLDGQNIFVTMNQNGEIRFGRNNKDLETGGFDRDFIFTKWADNEGVQTLYSTAYDTFSDCLRGISPEFFIVKGANAQIWMNCEVINSANPNVIPYSENKVSIHGLIAYEIGTKNVVDIPDYDEKMSILKSHLETTQSQHGKAQITPEVALSIVKESQQLNQEFKKELNDIVMMVDGGYPSMTIADWKRVRQKKIMAKYGYGELFELGELTPILVRRMIDGVKPKEHPECSSVSIKKWLIANVPDKTKAAELYALVNDKYKVDQKVIEKETMEPLEDFSVKLGTSVIEMVTGYDNESRKSEVIDSMINNLNIKVATIRMNPGDTDSYNKMMIQLKKLEAAGNKINAVEGIVFNWRGRTMKLTGCFAPLNQIMGIGKYGR